MSKKNDEYVCNKPLAEAIGRVMKFIEAKGPAAVDSNLVIAKAGEHQLTVHDLLELVSAIPMTEEHVIDTQENKKIAVGDLSKVELRGILRNIIYTERMRAQAIHDIVGAVGGVLFGEAAFGGPGPGKDKLH